MIRKDGKIERPILFSGPMVKAILEGRKTMTRRIFPVSDLESDPSAIHPDGSGKGFIAWWGERVPSAEETATKFYPGEEGVKCRYGQPGDILWVREKWIVDEMYDGVPPRELSGQQTVDYPATDIPFHLGRKRPSIHMPRWASRVDLLITGVKVERLQDISEEDAKAEGAPCELHRLDSVRLDANSNYRSGFERIWTDINGEESWADNPWVWVVSFERIKP